MSTNTSIYERVKNLFFREIDGDFLRKEHVLREKDHAKLDTPRGIRTIVNIQYIQKESSQRALLPKIDPEMKRKRDESVLFKHHLTNLPLTTTTDHRPSLNHHLPTLLSPRP